MNRDEAKTGGAAIVEALIANGVETVFGLPGAQMYPLFDALQQNADRIRTYGARHEQTCGYMAFGYARSTGKPKKDAKPTCVSSVVMIPSRGSTSRMTSR